MRVILKRHVTRDHAGRPIAVRYERVTDDEAGRVHHSDERTAHACTGCGRFVTDTEQRRGVCQACGRRECCDHCASRCHVCQRQLCGMCRRGFTGPPPITVCRICQASLVVRRRLDDHRQLTTTQFDRQMEYQRLINQIESQRHSTQHAQLSIQLQAARQGLRIVTPSRWRWACKLIKHVAGWMVPHGRPRSLR